MIGNTKIALTGIGKWFFFHEARKGNFNKGMIFPRLLAAALKHYLIVDEINCGDFGLTQMSTAGLAEVGVNAMG